MYLKIDNNLSTDLIKMLELILSLDENVLNRLIGEHSVGKVILSDLVIPTYSDITLTIGTGEDHFSSVESALSHILDIYPCFHVVVVGSKTLCDSVLENQAHLISKIHLGGGGEGGGEGLTFDGFARTQGGLLEPVYIPGELQYLKLLKEVMNNGVEEQGRNGLTLHKFHHQLSFDLSLEFPLLKTKRMFTRGIIEELFFFLRGDTNTKLLEEKGVNIWKGNTSREFLDSVGLDYPEGMMGPMYGYQWRFFGAEYHPCVAFAEPTGGIDQLQNVINEIKQNPTSRRLILTDFNPSQVHMGVLYPCHSLVIQFNVRGNFLDMFCYNRSSDLFLGLPFNIASSSLFLMIIAKLTGLRAGKFHLTLGDCHIYKQHTQAVYEQLSRVPYKPPTARIDVSKCGSDIVTCGDIDGFLAQIKTEHIIIENYKYHPGIKAAMIA